MRPFLTLHHPAAARAHYEAGLWRRETLYGLLAAHAEARPEAPAARDGTRTLGWRALRDWVDGVAAHLDGALRIGAGERVAIWAGNRLETLVLFLACARQGIACNPSLHRTYTADEIPPLLAALSARALLSEPGWGADRLADPVARFGALPGLAAVLTPAGFPGPGAAPGPAVADPDKVAYLAFTSGTTGTPKCVMHSDNTLLANARDLVRDWGHGPDSVILTLSPLSHHIAWVAVAQWLVAGALLVTDDPPAGTGRLDWILGNRATYVLGVPTHAMDVLAAAGERGLDALGAVRCFYMAGAPIPPAVAEAFVRLGVRPQNVYGMTENSSHHYTHPDDPTEVIVETCGRGGRAYTIGLFDPADPDRPAAPGEIGEIGGRGAALMLGYFGNQAATEASFNREGWFLSGDLGMIDARGNLRVVGRSKDLIIRGGHNIHPARIEALALRHPAVARAAAFPVPDERLGERVCLAVIGEIGAEALLAHLAAEGLSRYDMPEWFLRLDAFPLTASGKVLKRELAAMARAGTLRPEPVRRAGAGEA
ncbi:cyclohexanecarboxylate-CoA ligase [Pseudoroseomonas rhizosphaerae]|uniref:Cyclohexanecarboxylate-CoA ligase n=1 Tax=Teichococcus rhizosphaerae TaxID=1335062 RepID=A0A2C7A8P5_9PROT|nr:class I adenylate-forming enzyme family protein [Pseudoroseomonas rhizosphaerae]PHK94389.1 cyclohexanecarboxylate-CoA ligase [Pseudoroseomonas rhizosphaerae]